MFVLENVDDLSITAVTTILAEENTSDQKNRQLWEIANSHNQKGKTLCRKILVAFTINSTPPPTINSKKTSVITT